MRKLSKNYSKMNFKLLIIFAVIILMFMTCGYSLFKSRLQINGSCSINPNYMNDKNETSKTIETITDGNAKLILEQFEEEIKTYTIEKNLEYISNVQNERQYIIKINNQSSNNYAKVRANIYFGSENILVSIDPCDIIYKYDTNVTFETPTWMQISQKGTTSIYINIITEDDNFIPDIVVVALEKQI